MSSVNKVLDSIGLPSMYTELKMSIPQIAEATGVPRSRVRTLLLDCGVELRSRALGVQLAAGRISKGLAGKKRAFSEDHKANIRARAIQRGKERAVGVSRKPNGYIEYTSGPNKGRAVHVVKVEQWIGRKLLKDECVHHVDGDRSNNDSNNLALMTRGGHSRLHRLQERLAGKERSRENGRFC
jgi:hypothetical protein